MPDHRRGHEFPNEGFVQQVIEEHFTAPRFRPLRGGHQDLMCVCSESDETWIIEAKGFTGSDTRTDIQTGLGQLLQGMSEETWHAAIAIPQHQKCLDQIGQLAPWVRKALNLHVLVVNIDRTVAIYGPEEDITRAAAHAG